MKLSCVSENLGPVKIYYKDDLRNEPAITRDTFQISKGLDCKDEYFSQDVLIHNTMMSNWLPTVARAEMQAAAESISIVMTTPEDL
jgi:hypothetical protein